MSKYITIFKVAWQNEFTYRLNFALLRIRSVIRFLATYFLATAVFSNQNNLFGYNKAEILAYVFIVLIISTLILATPSADYIGGEIGSGDLSNYLLKPINYLKYWFTRDLSSKLLNLLFSFLEVTILYFILRPPLQFNLSALNALAFLYLLICSICLFFLVSSVTRLAAFWIPEDVWGIAFVVNASVEILSGMLFPLNVFPEYIQKILQFTPYPYLIFYPIQALQGKISSLDLLRISLQSSLWIILLIYFTNYIWKKGLKKYGAEGR